MLTTALLRRLAWRHEKRSALLISPRLLPTNLHRSFTPIRDLAQKTAQVMSKQLPSIWFSRSSILTFDLLTFATHQVVPVHEGTLGVVPPGPDVELEERIDGEAIRQADEIEDLPVEYRRRVVVGGEPGRRVQDELDAYQGHLAIRGLVDEGLRLRGVEGEITEQGGVDVVHAHRP